MTSHEAESSEIGAGNFSSWWLEERLHSRAIHRVPLLLLLLLLLPFAPPSLSTALSTMSFLMQTRNVSCIRSLARCARPFAAVPRAWHAQSLCSTTKWANSKAQQPIEQHDHSEPLEQPPEATWEVRPQSAMSGMSEQVKAILERDQKPALGAKEYSQIMNGFPIPQDLPTYISIAKFPSDNIKHVRRLLSRSALTIFRHREPNYLVTWVVRFPTHEDAWNEIDRLHNKVVNGRRLRVGFWKSKAASSLARLRHLPSQTPLNEV